MKPYYEHGGVSIYHADCREVLPELSADVLVTDPPYVGLKGGMTYSSPGGVVPRRSSAVTVGDPWSADFQWLPVACSRVLSGGFVFSSFHSVAETKLALSDDCSVVALLVWWKRNSPLAVRNVPRYTTEYIWAFRKPSQILNWKAITDCVIDTPMLQAGCMAVERFTDDSGRSVHPAQKPLTVMKRLLLVGGDSVLDPFAGTGTTLLAAKQLGRKAIGVEIEERYCEIAAKRLSQEVFSFDATEVVA